MYMIFHRATTFTHTAHELCSVKSVMLVYNIGNYVLFYLPRTKRWCVPKGLTNRLGYWKAEELHKFAYPVLGKTFTFHFTCKVIKVNMKSVH